VNARQLFALTAALAGLFGTAPIAARPQAQPPIAAGWKLDISASGDLTGDGVRDVAMVVRGDDPKLTIHNDRLGQSELDTNPRRLLVFAGTGSGFRQIAASDRMIPPAGDAESSCLEDPLAEGEIAIARNVLSVKLHYWLSCGSWGVTTNTFRFRLERGRFRLIGFDRMEFMRNSGEGEETSVNFLTARKSRTLFAIDDSIPKKLRWSRIRPQRHYLDSLNLEACLQVDKTTTLC
jgi:hypothetical protein